MGSFQVQPGNARPGGPCRGQGRRGGRWRRRHQRRQQAAGAEGPVGGGDSVHRFAGRGVVEQHPAAAVHLSVHEARRQNTAIDFLRDGVGRDFGRRHDVDDGLVQDEHRRVVMPAAAVENARSREGRGLHQGPAGRARRRLPAACRARSMAPASASRRAGTITGARRLGRRLA